MIPPCKKNGCSHTLFICLPDVLFTCLPDVLLTCLPDLHPLLLTPMSQEDEAKKMQEDGIAD